MQAADPLAGDSRPNAVGDVMSEPLLFKIMECVDADWNKTEVEALEGVLAQQQNDLLEVAKWIVNDTLYKAPEQLGDGWVTDRWINRLKAAIAKAEAP